MALNRPVIIILPFVLGILTLMSTVVLGSKGLAGVTGLCLLIIAAPFTIKYSNTIALAALAMLCTMPFFLGIKIGPKIFLDEILLLLLFVIVGARLLLRWDIWRLTTSEVLNLLVPLVLMSAVFVAIRPDYVSLRTFLESFGLGALLCLLFMQISTRQMLHNASLVFLGVVILISALGIAEYLFNKNPLMDFADKGAGGAGFIYLSPSLSASTGAAYRPYVTFFHPSEGATVVALCLPFILALWSNKKLRRLIVFTLLLAIAFLAVNATRGVWVSLFVTALVLWPLARRLVLFGSPFIIVTLIATVSLLHDRPFVQRLIDPTNLIDRLFYWNRGFELLRDNVLLGIGMGQFKEQYLLAGMITGIDTPKDLNKVAAMDNVYILITTEQGLIGLLGLVLLLVYIFRRLFREYKGFKQRHEQEMAVYMKAAMAALLIYLGCGMLADVHLFSKATKLCFIIVGLAMGAAVYVRERAKLKNLADVSPWRTEKNSAAPPPAGQDATEETDNNAITGR